MDQPLYDEKRFGFQFTVWPTRIEISDGLFTLAKHTTILLRAITDVSRGGIDRQLRITTQDGSTKKFVLRHPDVAREVIFALL